MENKTRVEKYKKHREEISQMDTYRFDNPYSMPIEEDENDMAMSEETLKSEHIKKSTLSISLEQLIKAHDEYTVMISQDEINRKKKEERRNKLREIRNISLIIGSIIIIILLLVIAIILLWN